MLLADAPDEELIAELRRRTEPLQGHDLLNEPRLVKQYLVTRESYDRQEQTGALFLDTRNRLIVYEPGIYRGTLDRGVVEPREFLRRALKHSAAGLILFHNHPSGDPSPSREDREMTRRTKAAAEAVGLLLLDHVVIGRDGAVSLREAGLL